MPWMFWNYTYNFDTVKHVIPAEWMLVAHRQAYSTVKKLAGNGQCLQLCGAFLGAALIDIRKKSPPFPFSMSTQTRIVIDASPVKHVATCIHIEDTQVDNEDDQPLDSQQC